jgi:polyphosphate kinase
MIVISSMRVSSTFKTAATLSTFLASADWMPRNFEPPGRDRFPVLDPSLQNRLKQVLETQLADDVKRLVDAE